MTLYCLFIKWAYQKTNNQANGTEQKPPLEGGGFHINQTGISEDHFPLK